MKKKIYLFRSLFLVFLTLQLLHIRTSAQAIETDIHKLIEQYKAVGLSVVVIKDGKPFYSKAFGFQNREEQKPLELSNLFRIASISKSFSATSIMQLVEQKKVTLDADVSDLIGFRVRNPNYPETVITLRMLLSHSSSLNDSQGYFTLDVINPAKNNGNTKYYSNNQPGTKYDYCNLNYNMVGAIIERLSGERFDLYVYNHILKPLGLTRDGYHLDSLDRSQFATLYEYNKETGAFTPAPAAYTSKGKEIADNYTLGYSAPMFSPTGGLKISGPDLARYASMHMNSGKLDGVRIISKKSSKIMQTPVLEADQYGLGLWKSTKLIPGLELTGHTGSAYGLYSMMVFNSKQKFAIVAITNGCDPVYSNGNNELLSKTVNLLYNQLVLP